MKSKGLAYFLCLISFLGWLGLHRFYLGKFGTDQANTNQELKTLRKIANEIASITRSRLY